MTAKNTKHPGGRPLFDGKSEELVIQKLEEAFAFGASDLEACFYADISKTALYEYQKKHPSFQERKEKLKERPILLARQSVVSGLKDSPELALKFLERKRKSEFALRSEFTGAEGEQLQGIVIYRPEKRPEDYDDPSRPSTND